MASAIHPVGSEAARRADARRSHRVYAYSAIAAALVTAILYVL